MLVPEPTVRGAWLAAASDFQLDALREPEDADRSDWIADVAQELAAKYSGKSVLLPERIRAIDARIAAAGIPFALPEVAPFDRGAHDTEPYTSRDFLTTAVSAFLGGTGEFSQGDLAVVSRALAPPGAAVPVASMLDYPDGGPQLADINDGRGLTLLPGGDARVELERILTEASIPQLRAAWQAVDDMYRWAVSLCEVVEAELDALAAGEPLPDCLRPAAVVRRDHVRPEPAAAAPGASGAGAVHEGQGEYSDNPSLHGYGREPAAGDAA
ncbi:hypothetical protein ACWDUH_04945 [Micromonospora wenchangensis]